MQHIDNNAYADDDDYIDVKMLYSPIWMCVHSTYSLTSSSERLN